MGAIMSQAAKKLKIPRCDLRVEHPLRCEGPLCV